MVFRVDHVTEKDMRMFISEEKEVDNKKLAGAITAKRVSVE